MGTQGALDAPKMIILKATGTLMGPQMASMAFCQLHVSTIGAKCSKDDPSGSQVSLMAIHKVSYVRQNQEVRAYVPNYVRTQYVRT